MLVFVELAKFAKSVHKVNWLQWQCLLSTTVNWKILESHTSCTQARCTAIYKENSMYFLNLLFRTRSSSARFEDLI